jgi:hypothetical protein
MKHDAPPTGSLPSSVHTNAQRAHHICTRRGGSVASEREVRRSGRPRRKKSAGDASDIFRLLPERDERVCRIHSRQHSCIRIVQLLIAQVAPLLVSSRLAMPQPVQMIRHRVSLHPLDNDVGETCRLENQRVEHVRRGQATRQICSHAADASRAGPEVQPDPPPSPPSSSPACEAQGARSKA